MAEPHEGTSPWTAPIRADAEPPPGPRPADSPFELVSEFEPKGDQPAAIGELVDGPRAGGQAPGPAGGHRQRQDLHHRLRPGPGQPPGAGPRPQQDPGRPALPGVQVLLPAQRRRVLRLLLRLLPARGLRPPVRHLHRQGSDDQRRDRPHAPLRHPQPVRAAGRGHRGLGVLHLRPRLAGGVLRDAAVRARRARPSTATSCWPSWWRRATTATTTS